MALMTHCCHSLMKFAAMRDARLLQFLYHEQNRSTAAPPVCIFLP